MIKRQKHFLLYTWMYNCTRGMTFKLNALQRLNFHLGWMISVAWCTWITDVLIYTYCNQSESWWDDFGKYNQSKSKLALPLWFNGLWPPWVLSLPHQPLIMIKPSFLKDGSRVSMYTLYQLFPHRKWHLMNTFLNLPQATKLSVPYLERGDLSQLQWCTRYCLNLQWLNNSCAGLWDEV